MSAREVMTDTHGPMLFLDDPLFDGAILGVADRAPGTPVVVYDAEAVVRVYMARDGMTFDEATEFADFNTFGAWMGEQTPIYVHRWYGVAG